MVTSRYRAERLSDVPDSITAFKVADTERYRIERINRVASLTPNLRFSDDQEVGVSTLVIRGVRQNRGTGQPPGHSPGSIDRLRRDQGPRRASAAMLTVCPRCVPILSARPA